MSYITPFDPMKNPTKSSKHTRSRLSLYSLILAILSFVIPFFFQVAADWFESSNPYPKDIQSDENTLWAFLVGGIIVQSLAALSAIVLGILALRRQRSQGSLLKKIMAIVSIGLGITNIIFLIFGIISVIQILAFYATT